MTAKAVEDSENQTRWKWLLAGLAVIALLVASRLFELEASLLRLLDWIHALGAWAPLLFVVAYILTTVVFIPGTILTLGAGAIFGVIEGTIYSSLGSTLGATAAFLIGRTAARDTIARKIQANQKFLAIDRAVAREGWKIVLLTRLSPIFPFTFLNYAFGITHISLGAYVVASWLGMVPGTVMYVYMGSLAKAGLGDHERTRGEWTLYGTGMIATIAVTVYVTYLARAALKERTGGDKIIADSR